MARIEPGDGQCRRAAGTVFRSIRRERRGRDLPAREFRPEHPEQGIPQRASGAHLSWGRGLP